MPNVEKIKNFIKDNYIIIIILLLAFGVRWYGIYFDYPVGVTYIWDEIFNIAQLASRLEAYSWFGGGDNSYPFLLSVVYIPFAVIRIGYLALVNHLYSVGEIKNYLVEFGFGSLYIVIRWVSVFFGTATAFLIYKISRLIYKNISSAYYATLVYSFSLVPVFLSHWGKHHVPMVFFVVLALYFILIFEQQKNLKYFYFSVAAAAGSVSTHYLGIFAASIPFLGLAFNFRAFNAKVIIKSIVLYGLIMFFFFALNYQNIWQMLLSQLSFWKATGFTGMYLVGRAERFYYIFRETVKLEPIFLVVFFVMMILNFKLIIKDSLKKYIFLVILLNYLLMVAIAGIFVSRWLLIFVTLAMPFGAGLLLEYFYEKNIKKHFIFGIALLLILPSIYFTYRWDRILSVNTNKEAAAWISQNLKNNQNLYNFNNWFDIQPSYEAVLWDKENNHRTSKKENYILENKEKFLNKGFNVFYDYDNRRFDTLGGKNTKYIMIYYWLTEGLGRYTGGDVLTKNESYKALDEIKKYHELKPVVTFYPTKSQYLLDKGIGDYLNNPLSWLDLYYLDKSGPFIEIYEVLK